VSEVGEGGWRRIWEEKAKEKDFAASGRSSGDPAQLFALLGDACRALQPTPADRLLDVGCGVGLLGRHLQPYVGSFVGLDFALTLLFRAREALPRGLFVGGSLMELPFPRGAFSKVLASSVLQYLDGDEAVGLALSELRRVTSEGGRVFASGNPDRTRKDEYILGIDRLDLPGEKRRLIRDRNQKAFWISPEQLKAQAEGAGFRAEVRPIAPEVWQSFYMFDLLLIAR